MTDAADKIIVALDVPSKKEALALVDQLRGQISFFKVGLQLYTAAGSEVVREIVRQNANVFLDLKLHDIPNTVASAVAAASELGARMLTVHLSGGRVMLEAAVAAKTPDLLLLGVSVLTSADETTLRETALVRLLNNRWSDLRHWASTLASMASSRVRMKSKLCARVSATRS